LAWQQYEVLNNKKKPKHYPYKDATSLFSVFRYLSEIFLLQLSQMTFFASTYYESWSTIIDSTKYARAQPEITRTCTLPLLDERGIKKTLKELKITPQWCFDCDLSKWYGRPGFFYDYLAISLLENPPSNKKTFVDMHETALSEAKECVDRFFNDTKLNNIVIHFIY
jgi:hypothetical protein